MLASLLHETSIAKRKEGLKKYVQLAPTSSTINDEDSRVLTSLYIKFYIPKEDEVKLPVEYIMRWVVQGTSKKNLYIVTIDRKLILIRRDGLAGARPITKDLYEIAMRHAVEDQLLAFAHQNPLDPYELCPILRYSPLGKDAVVGYIGTPFVEIKRAWMLANPNTILVNDVNSGEKVLPALFESSWKHFHAIIATLGWISKKAS